MAKDVIITPASGLVEFKDNTVLKGSIYETAGDIVINPVTGSVVLGDGTPANILAGGVGVPVNITLQGGGSLSSNAGTLGIGVSGDTVNFTVAGVTYNWPTTLMRTADYTATDILTRLKTVDGAGSGLDADFLDGYTTGTVGAVIPLLSTANTWSAAQTIPTLAGNTQITGTLTTTGAISGTSYTGTGATFTSVGGATHGQIRIKGAADATGYGVIHRHDGADYYLLLTANNDANGSWTTARPFVINLATGAVGLGATTAASLTVTGDLTVNGTTTTVNSTTITVDDKNLELGSVATPTDATADGGGITLRGATDKTFNWISATGYWTSNQSISAPRLISTVAQGTSPLVVTSNTLVTNLNADLLDGADFTSRDNSIFKTAGAYIAGGVYYNGGWKNQNATGHGFYLRHSDASGVTAGFGGRLDIGFGFDASTGVDTAAATLRTFSFDRTGQLTLPAPTGTAPLVVSSTTLVANLNADLLDGYSVGTSGSTIPLLNTANTWSANQTISAGLTIDGTIATGASDMGGFRGAGTNLILKGDAFGRSGIFFQSEKDGVNINHSTDYGFIQFHPYGLDGVGGEANRLVIGVANDLDDFVVLQAPSRNGLKFSFLDATSGSTMPLYNIYHEANFPDDTVLNDIANQFDGAKAVFDLRVEQTAVTSLVDSKELEVVIAGQKLNPYIDILTYPWLSPYDSFKGFRVRSGQVTIYNAPYAGDSSHISYRKPSVSRQKRRYPFSAATIAFGD